MSEDESLLHTFGKIGGSYHGGIDSIAYIDHTTKTNAANALNARSINGDITCPYCNKWNTSNCFIHEDSVARGGLHRCQVGDCNKEFYSWISDGYLYGHKVEYRYGRIGSDDYRNLNEGRED